MNKFKNFLSNVITTYAGITWQEGVGILVMAVAAVWSARTGSVFAILLGAMAGVSLFIIKGHDVRTRISPITLVFIIGAACSLVTHLQPKGDYTSWLIAKMMFVAFFGLFGGHLLGLLNWGKRTTIAIVLGAGALWFAMLMKDNNWLNYPTDAGYKWSDLVEDMLLGIASLLYPAIVPPVSAPPAAGSQPPAGVAVASPPTSLNGTGTANGVSQAQPSQTGDRPAS